MRFDRIAKGSGGLGRGLIFRRSSPLAFVLLLFGVSAAAAQDRSFYDYPSTALTGHVAAEFSYREDGCRKVCAERSGCKGFEFAQSNGMCRIYSSVSGARQDAGSAAGARALIGGYAQPSNPPVAERLSAPPQTQEADAPSRRDGKDVASLENGQDRDDVPDEPIDNGQDRSALQFQQFQHYDLSGAEDIGRQTAQSRSECENICRGTDDCQAYTFNAWNRACFLKGGTGILRMDPRSTSGVMDALGTPERSSAELVMEYYNNSVMSGTPISSSQASSRGECEQQCWGDDRCAAFSLRRGGMCQLFDNPPNRSPQNGTMSGGKIQKAL
ncbi:hypothetical protein K9B32_16435 [Rhizobium sp. 3T7]|uniref:PAN domain-containing protein n=1 Tax=Rhizobium sp. 3T7 TaxID=2874922 RepID=UPI001CCB2887|nr:PAN domain-containing protein [Rhizobium sp. 3T7]MBZ9791694.1 hypothetical protein [Rhizobium sp. 3T7]